MLEQNLFNFYLDQKMQLLTRIRERNHSVRVIREAINKLNIRDHREAVRYDKIMEKMVVDKPVDNKVEIKSV